MQEPFLGGGIGFQEATESDVVECLWQALTQRVPGSRVVRQTEIAADDMFEQTGARGLHQRGHHVAEHS